MIDHVEGFCPNFQSDLLAKQNLLEHRVSREHCGGAEPVHPHNGVSSKLTGATWHPKLRPTSLSVDSTPPCIHALDVYRKAKDASNRMM